VERAGTSLSLDTAILQPWLLHPVYIHNKGQQEKEKKMTTEPQSTRQEQQKPKVIRHTGASEAVYGLGMVGAWVYFISHATTFWMGVLGVLKGIVWPALLVFEALKSLHM
jgi:hypothetical protein